MRLPEALVLNVVHVPQHTPTESVSPNPPEIQGWQAAPAPVQTGGQANPNRPANELKMAGGRSTQVNKTELIERVAQEAKVSTSEAQKHFEAFERVVTEALKGGEEVRITGFGKFSVRERKSREGRNPQTGEKIKIPAQRVPAFSAGNALKEAV
jgi:DNA-binding protein HU-beta